MNQYNLHFELITYMQVLDFSLEPHDRCQYDYLEVISGTNKRRQCGDLRNRKQYQYNTKKIQVQFQSDDTEHRRGFWIGFHGNFFNVG